ncbi:hypothetical protein ECE50_024945 [Chitinophaga sp. Mgbs1]|uniref:Uncharacterized protein n=1 Tax=Chitinophaga solisilvae TaxID=1233460 RepID=A0A3S1BFT8_9BACT|nr:hypothetical protein [Chitinophaga solisilvae]
MFLSLEKLSLLLAGSILAAISLSAQPGTVIGGKFAGRAGAKVSLSYWEEPGISPAVTMDTLLQRDTFCFRLPRYSRPLVFFYADAGAGNHFYGTVRMGDSVFIRFEEDTVIFSGGGAVACRAQYLAGRAQQHILPGGTAPEAMAACYRLRLTAAEKVLQFYRDSLSASQFQVIRANVLGETAGLLLSCLWKFPPDSTRPDRQAACYRQQIAPALPVIAATDTTVMAIRYLHFLLQRAEADCFLQQGAQFSDQGVYEWIKARYNGVLRDKLLAHQLLQGLAAGGQQDELALCARDYLSFVQHPGCRQLIASRYGVIRKGVRKGIPAPVFSLPDNNGRSWDLRTLSGKVVLLHFCDAGDPLLNTLTEIKPCFNKEEVVFFHIGRDVHSLVKYPGIPLQADGRLQELSEQYSISQYPALIIIGKNGQIYATRPPDPAADHGTALTNIIYAALLQ